MAGADKWPNGASGSGGITLPPTARDTHGLMRALTTRAARRTFTT